jgi:hypothetical protein
MPLENCGSIHLALKTSLFLKLIYVIFENYETTLLAGKKFGNQERNEEKTTVN